MSKVGKFRQRSRHFILKKELKISNSGNKKYLFFWTFGNSTDFDFCRSVFLFGKLFCVSYDLIWAQKGRNCQKCRTLGSINTNWKLFQKGRNCQKCRTLGSINTNWKLFQKGRNCQKCRTLGSINTNWKLFQKGRNCQKCRTLGSINTN
jgi:hypothetical protein